ncbi:MAG: hypothetical protein HQ497_04650 [SAR86 cluster bacterium]|uniref:DUF3718 domain-containing protein n=1 Tax=SAR86 cluster bacterium TaxID=2030880 RepID=A0A973A9D2_9GAMM|nr:hypothetical protein [SAR86 cluster bacterium]
MKHLMCLFVAMSLSINAYSKEIQLDDGARFVTKDENPYSQLCIAALESRDAIKAKAEELGIGRRAQKQVVCNDLSLYEFAEKHREDIREWSVANVQ